VSGEVVYTLGTSYRTPDEFLALLKDVGVEVVVDVRRFPTSRFKHFEKDELSRLLEREGFNYIYLGEELGGYRRKGYEAYVGTEEFRKGLSRLEELACERSVVILCAERLPWWCHKGLLTGSWNGMDSKLLMSSMKKGCGCPEVRLMGMVERQGFIFT